MEIKFDDLMNKSILLTGANRGIGRAIADSLAKNRAHIIFNYRGDADQAMALKEQFLTLGASRVTPLSFDITNFSQMEECLKTYLANNDPISGLVNNAGVSKDQLSMRVKADDLEFILNTNLKSTMHLTNLLSKNFLKAQNSSIVNMSSVVGMMGNKSQTTYAASKAGVIGYTKSLAKELASKKVRVNAIAPGFISTQMTNQLNEKAKQSYQELIPLGEYGEANDVANLTLFLLSSASKYITGEVVKIDGGLYI